jgi:alkylation response protein AidB-like acyl-CoA dehydrogenase
MVQHFGLQDDPLLRDHLAALYVNQKVNEWTTRRAAASLARGNPPGPELSTLKLAGTKHIVQISSFVERVLGPRLLADTGEWGTYAWTQFVCGVPGGRLGGGTDEVLRNIIGERVLGLPKEPGGDRTTPFKDLPRNG